MSFRFKQRFMRRMSAHALDPSETRGPVDAGWSAMRWVATAWVALLMLWGMLTVQLDIDEKSRDAQELVRARHVELAKADCMMRNMTDEQKSLMARVVTTKFSTPESESMWSNLLRVGRVCHVDSDEIMIRREWPGMFNRLAAMDNFYRDALRAEVSVPARAP